MIVGTTGIDGDISRDRSSSPPVRLVDHPEDVSESTMSAIAEKSASADEHSVMADGTGGVGGGGVTPATASAFRSPASSMAADGIKSVVVGRAIASRSNLGRTGVIR